MAAPRPTDVSLETLHRTFISGCHILHYHGVLDAYGHLSFRHPTNPEIFIMSRYIAPGTISSPGDLIEYHVETAEPVSPTGAAKGYAERAIHSECYRRFPAVGSVIHSHSEEVVPYSVCPVPLRPVYHMAGFLGTHVPVWDMTTALRDDDIPDMLVRNSHLGASLAACFAASEDGEAKDEPDHAVVLMRGHGLTVVAPSIEDCVMRAVYTQKNAMVQTKTLTLAAAYSTGAGAIRPADTITYLSEREAKAAAEMTKWSAMRPWKLWLREVEASNLYVNMA